MNIYINKNNNPKLVEPGVFGRAGQYTTWPKYAGVDRLLSWLVPFLGITRYSLGRLLCTGDVSAVYVWENGGKRPSPIYLLRMFALVQLRLEGVALRQVYRINWETGAIVYKTAYGRKPSDEA